MAHRKTVRHFHEVGHLHELTFSCYLRMPLLTNETWREKLARSIDNAREETGIKLIGFVFMPEHVHLLVYPTISNPTISTYLARVKQPFSTQIKEILVNNRSRLLQKLTVLERPGKMCFRYWQEGPGFDRNLFSGEAISLSLEYIHNNPVRRGLCGSPVDWFWSSARYFHEFPAPQNPSLPRIHGLPDGAVS